MNTKRKSNRGFIEIGLIIAIAAVHAFAFVGIGITQMWDASEGGFVYEQSSY